MLIKIIRGTVVNKKAVLPGEVVETSDRDGKYLIDLGKAEAAEESKKPAPRKKSTKETATRKPAEKAVKE